MTRLEVVFASRRSDNGGIDGGIIADRSGHLFECVGGAAGSRRYDPGRFDPAVRHYTFSAPRDDFTFVEAGGGFLRSWLLQQMT